MSAAPRRQLGLAVTAAIVVANMIGTGVFTSTGFQANSLHDPMTILIAWVIGGVIALCGAAAYAELGAMMPRAGGEYVYLREAYHPAVGYVSGWVSLTAGFSAPIAVSSLAFSAYASTLFPGLEGHGAQQLIAIGLIVLVTCLHVFDTKVGGWVQAGFTAAKVVLIVVFILGGLLVGRGDWGHLASQHGGFENIGTKSFAMALMYVSFAYSGWNAAAYIASDIKDPGRTLPRALLLGTGVVMLLYVVLNLVFFYAVPSDTLAGPSNDFKPVIEVGDLAARSLFGDRAGQAVTVMISLALVSSVSAMVMAGPRVYAAMANDGALPKFLGFHSKRGVPTITVLVQGALGILFVLVGSLGELIQFVGFTLAIFAALTVAAVFILRARGLAAPYRTWGYPVTPVLFILMSVWIAYAQFVAHPMSSLIVVGGLTVIGVLYYTLLPAPRRAEAPLPAARVVTEE